MKVTRRHSLVGSLVFSLALTACTSGHSHVQDDSGQNEAASANGTAAMPSTNSNATPIAPPDAGELIKAAVLPDTDGGSYKDLAGVATTAFGDAGALNVTSFSQGPSNDCGALSGIIAVAGAQPDVIRRNLMYLGRDGSNIDTYRTYLYVDGKWQTYVVNVNTPDNQSHPNDNAKGPGGATIMWGPLYEKALAAAVGGYTKLNGINTTDVMMMLTGQEAAQNPGDGDQAVEHLQHNKPTTVVGTSGGPGFYDATTGERLGDGSMPHAIEIHDQHYYATAGFTDSNQTAITVVNPWNQGPGSGGSFVLSLEAYKKIFWAYSFVN